VCILLLLLSEHWFNFIISAIIKSHNQIWANIIYKETHSKGLHRRNLKIFRTFRNVVTRPVNRINALELVHYVIYTLAIPFDLRCESGTYNMSEVKNVSSIPIH